MRGAACQVLRRSFKLNTSERWGDGDAVLPHAGNSETCAAGAETELFGCFTFEAVVSAVGEISLYFSGDLAPFAGDADLPFLITKLRYILRQVSYL